MQSVIQRTSIKALSEELNFIRPYYALAKLAHYSDGKVTVHVHNSTATAYFDRISVRITELRFELAAAPSGDYVEIIEYKRLMRELINKLQGLLNQPV